MAASLRRTAGPSKRSGQRPRTPHDEVPNGRQELLPTTADIVLTRVAARPHQPHHRGTGPMPARHALWIELARALPPLGRRCPQQLMGPASTAYAKLRRPHGSDLSYSRRRRVCGGVGQPNTRSAHSTRDRGTRPAARYARLGRGRPGSARQIIHPGIRNRHVDTSRGSTTPSGAALRVSSGGVAKASALSEVSVLELRSEWNTARCSVATKSSMIRLRSSVEERLLDAAVSSRLYNYSSSYVCET